MQGRTAKVIRATGGFGVAGLLAVVTACGGGGEPGAVAPVTSQALVLSSGNCVSATSVALSTGVAVMNPLAILIGAGVDTPMQGLRTALAHARGAWPRRAAAPALVTGAVVSESLACPEGGTVTVSTDAASPSATSVGDTVTFSFDNCGEAGVVTQGSFSARIDSLAGDIDHSDQYQVGMTLTLSGLTTVGLGSTLVSQGSMTMDLHSHSATRMDLTVTMPAIRVTGMMAGSAYERTTTQLVMSSRMADNGDATLEIRGRVGGSELGGAHVELETRTALFEAASDHAPRAGVVLVKGDRGGVVRLQALPGEVARLDLDADGDGTYETGTTRSWQEITGG